MRNSIFWVNIISKDKKCTKKSFDLLSDFTPQSNVQDTFPIVRLFTNSCTLILQAQANLSLKGTWEDTIEITFPKFQEESREGNMIKM